MRLPSLWTKVAFFSDRLARQRRSEKTVVIAENNSTIYQSLIDWEVQVVRLAEKTDEWFAERDQKVSSFQLC